MRTASIMGALVEQPPAGSIDLDGVHSLLEEPVEVRVVLEDEKRMMWTLEAGVLIEVGLALSLRTINGSTITRTIK